jgi:muramidase (phage lysozyme)
MAAQRLVDRGAMAPLLSGNLDAALSGASHEWAALPKGRNLSNRYQDQPYMPYDKVRSTFDLNLSPY